MDLRLDLPAIRALAEALALGLLVGIERYRGRGPGERSFAGVRTFAILAVLGAVSGLFEHPAVALTVFAAVALLVAAGYYRSEDDSPGLTTEIAALLVFWLGVLLHTHEVLAISTAIVLTVLLASKSSLHEFVREKITEAEFVDTLKFLVIVLVVYPLLPDGRLGPYDFLNPRQAWLLVILVSSIGYTGYFLMRWLGSARGLRLSAVAGGIISTTAATLSLAGRTRRHPESSRAYAGAAVIANAVQFPRLLLLLAAVGSSLAGKLALPLLAAGGAGLIVAWWASSTRSADPDVESLPLPANPLSLLPAFKFGAFFVVLLLVIEFAKTQLGSTGVYLASAVGGLGSVSAVVLSLAEQTARDAIGEAEAARALMLAIGANASSKAVLAAANGTRAFLVRLLLGLLAMLAAGAAALTAA